MVEHSLLNEDEFRDFAFANVARMQCSMNPNFFKGTIVEDEVAKLLGTETAPAEGRSEATLGNGVGR